MLAYKGVRPRTVEIEVKASPIVCSRGSGASAPPGAPSANTGAE
jgi:hypothetical protein